MVGEETHQRLLESLRSRVRSQWGRIAELEARLELSEGYLSRLLSGRNEFKLDLFLETISALGLEPKSFFAQALDIYPEPEDFLAQLEEPSQDDKALSAIARAALAFEESDPETPERRATADASHVAAFTRCSRREQVRRLSYSRKYRTPAFARAYLEHLDSLRYDDADGAARLTTAVATSLIPALSGSPTTRSSLHCLALGVFGSARRSKGRFTSAASAFRLALDLSRRQGLREESGNLLMRASYLLKDFGHFERARGLVKEALVIFVQTGSQWGMGKALVDLGMMDTALGDYHDAILDLEQAQRHLEGSEEPLRRYHLASYQFLAYAHEQLGNLEAAEDCLAEGARSFGPRHAVDQAKLQWLHGTLALRRGDYARSEALLREAGAVLSSKENPGQEALVALDLVSAIIAQGRTEEAAHLATGMARLLAQLESNKLAEAAILELVSAAVAGKLTGDLVNQVRVKLEQGHPQGRDATKRR